MSKYIKLEDAEKLLTNALRIAQGFDEPLERSLVDLPTIEVSEDAISREDAVNALIAHFIPQTYTGEQVEQASKLAWKIMANAPSVIPTAKEGEWIYNTTARTAERRRKEQRNEDRRRGHQSQRRKTHRRVRGVGYKRNSRRRRWFADNDSRLH